MIAINQDVSPQSLAPGYYVFAKNLLVQNIYDEVEGELGFRAIPQNLVSLSYIIGLIPVDNLVYILGKSTSNTDIILEYNETTNTFRVVVDRTDLNFNELYPITGKAKKSQIGEPILVFRDNLNPPRYINITRYTSNINIQRLNLFSTYPNPTITGTAVRGGNFETGTYFGCIQYVDSANNVTDTTVLSSPIYIENTPSYNSFKDPSYYKGGKTGVRSTSAILLTLNNLDTSFDKIRIVLIKKALGNTVPAVYKTLSISGTSMSVFLTGSEVTTPITLEEVLTKSPYYDRVGEMESLNDQLFLADLKIQEIFNFQEIANQITLKWRSTPVNQVNLSTLNLQPIKTFAHDEVYAMYIQFEVDGSRITDWFHIPGRVDSIAFDTTFSVPAGSDPIKFNGVNAKIFQISDTVENLSVVGDYANGAGGSYMQGLFSVWQNENEQYPSTFPNHAGQKVRHHKFPSLKYIANNAGAGNKVGTERWSQLSIVLDSIPFQLNTRITGYRLGYAQRDEANISVIGYDIVQLQSNPDPAESGGDPVRSNAFQNSGGNWGKRDVGSGTDGDTYPNKRYLRQHCPDVMYSKPNLIDSYIAGQRKFTIIEGVLNNKKGGIDHIGYYETGVKKLYAFLVDYTRNVNNIGQTVVNNSGVNYNITVQNYSYVKNGVDQIIPEGIVENLQGEEHIHIKTGTSLDINYIPVDNTGLTTGNRLAVKDADESVAQLDVFREEVDLITFKRPLANVFIDFINKQVVAGDFVRRVDGSFVAKMFSNGDLFISIHSFLSCGSIKISQLAPGIRITKVFALESRLNLSQRYVEDGNPATYFYPRYGTEVLTQVNDYWFANVNRTTDTEALSINVNTILYDTDHNGINNLEQFSVFDSQKEYISDYPFAIQRGRKTQQGILVQDGWKRFAANDIFYTVTNKGRITKLQAVGLDSLLIHHEDALYQTAPNVVLQSSIGEISAGSGDIFRIEPRDIKPNDQGYAGLQHKYGALLTPFGYIFIDARRGSLYLLDGGTLNDISSGIKNLLRDYLRTATGEEIPDNPFRSRGIQVGYDNKYKRIMVSVKNEPFSYTFSFDPSRKGVVSFHTAVYAGLVTTTRDLYSINSNILYKHNAGPRGVFYGGGINPWMIDVVINEEPKVDKILSSIGFISTVDNLLDLGITHITVRTSNFSTGRIALKRDISIYEKGNVSETDNEWFFNDLRNRLVNGAKVSNNLFNEYTNPASDFISTLVPFEAEKLRDKFFIVRFENDNTSGLRTALRAYNYLVRRSTT